MKTVHNRSNNSVLVGEKYLLPGASGEYSDAIAKAAVANHPDVLSIVDEAPVAAPEPAATPAQSNWPGLPDGAFMADEEEEEIEPADVEPDAKPKRSRKG